MANVYISTVRVSNERAIAPTVFRGAKVGQALAPEHHVVWSLFPREQTERTWLYRRLTDRALRVVSTAVPTSSPYATVLGTQEQRYEWLAPGMRLAFRLRANAVKRLAVDGKTRKADVVMHALHPLSTEERRERREEITRAAYLDWMGRQGEAHGFAIDQECFHVVAHYRERIARRNAAPALINCGELIGLLTVLDPQALRTCLGEGLGASRAFGCGLLEVSRVN
jgi:CRISPR-associated protein Cas6/Cse3/CasE subtype I-E